MTGQFESKPGILVRNAIIDESQAIASVLRLAFVEYEPLYTPGGFAATTPTADQIRARWDEGPVWVAINNWDIVGTVAAVPKDPGLYVRSMAVLPSARGQRIARALLKEIELFARNQRHTCLFLSTTPFLKQAIRLYKDFGFERSYEGEQDLFGTSLFRMVKTLQVTDQAQRKNS